MAVRWPRLGRRPKDGTEKKPNAVDLFVAADGDPDLYAALLAEAGLDQPARDRLTTTRQEQT